MKKLKIDPDIGPKRDRKFLHKYFINNRKAQRMNKHKYSENLRDDECFFFRVSKKLGAGTKKDPVHIMMSRSLMENCNYLDKGVFQIDDTYRLT